MSDFRIPAHWSRAQTLAVCEMLALLQQHLLEHYNEDGADRQALAARDTDVGDRPGDDYDIDF